MEISGGEKKLENAVSGSKVLKSCTVFKVSSLNVLRSHGLKVLRFQGIKGRSFVIIANLIRILDLTLTIGKKEWETGKQELFQFI